MSGEKCWIERRNGLTDRPTSTCPWRLWEIDFKVGEHEVSGKRIGKFDVKVEGDDILVEV